MELIKYREALLGGDILQLSLFTRNCDTIIAYLKNDGPLIFRHILPGNHFLYMPNCCDILNFRWACDYVISIFQNVRVSEMLMPTFLKIAWLNLC